MDTTLATSQSWNTIPMPPERKLIEVDLALSAHEYEKAQLGHIPEAMEDKWFIYFEYTWLNIHRSWTGLCIYRLRFESDGEGYKVVEAWVNRSPDEYNSANDEYDERMAIFVVEAILLGKRSSMP